MVRFWVYPRGGDLPGECFRETLRALLLALSTAEGGARGTRTWVWASHCSELASQQPSPWAHAESWAESLGTSELTKDSTALLCCLQTTSAQASSSSQLGLQKARSGPTALPGEPSAAEALPGTWAFAADIPSSRYGWQSCCSGCCKQRDPSPRGAGEDSS